MGTEDTHLVYTDNPGAIPATYEVPDTLSLDISSVFARIDGSGAAGPFLPCLSVYSQDGHLLARVPADQTLAIGDTATVTWAPFLRTATTGGATPSTLNACRLWTTNMATAIGNANDARMSFDNVSSFDPTVFSTTSFGGRIIRVRYAKAGWYAAFAEVVPSAFAAGSVDMHFLYVGDTLSGASVATESAAVGLHVGPYPSISITRYFPDELDSLPGLTELWVAQNSGGVMTINTAWWHHVYLGAGDF